MTKLRSEEFFSKMLVSGGDTHHFFGLYPVKFGVQGREHPPVFKVTLS
jgi:hypothetical protein